MNKTWTELLDRAYEVKKNAYVPYFGFHVGAALLGVKCSSQWRPDESV